MTEGSSGVPVQDARGSTVARRRGLGALLSASLPGLPQVLAGRWASGGFALWVWLGSLTILVTRWSLVMQAPRGPLDHRIAFATLITTLVGVWAWSFRDVRAHEKPDGREGAGQWRLAALSFARSRLAVLGLAAIATAYLVALLTPFIAPHDPYLQGDLVAESFLAPSMAHLLGTDRLARDILSRILYGARISLSIGFIAVGISVTIGTLLGAVSGYLGGRADTVIMRSVDVVMAFPRLVLLITIMALFEPSVFLIVLVLGLTQWPWTARIVRGEVLSLREREFVQAAIALGYSKARIILRHIVPNALGPVIVTATLGIGNTIVLEAGLSFLGLGVRSLPSWGSMVADGRGDLLAAWWLSTFPGLAIVFTVLCFNLVGDGLRDALDPRMGA